MIETVERDGVRIATITRADGSSYEVRSTKPLRGSNIDVGDVWFAGESPPPDDALEGLCVALLEEWAK